MVLASGMGNGVGWNGITMTTPRSESALAMIPQLYSLQDCNTTSEDSTDLECFGRHTA